MIGKTISHYKILAKLGEGGMGVVYKAEDTKLKRLVAIKFLPRRISVSEEERERFKIEAQAAAALNHPNIATMVRAGVPPDLEALIHKALAKDANARYQHANELLADLKSATTAPASESAGIVKENPSKRKRAFLYGGMAAFLILVIASGFYFLPERRGTIDAIAVLPLANLSGDPNKEFFADGMTEALISDLGQIEALRVISRTSVM